MLWLKKDILKKSWHSLRNIYKNPKIISMGDFNDDPFDKSIKKILGAKKEINEVGKNDLYNPFEKILVEKGIGTNAYRDKWQLFDQIILSKPFLKKNYNIKTIKRSK